MFSNWVSNIVKHAIAAGESVYRLDVKSVEVQNAKQEAKQDAKTALKNAVKKLGVSPGTQISSSRFLYSLATIRRFSDHEKYLKLTTECLHKTPKEACAGLTTYLECMELLEFMDLLIFCLLCNRICFLMMY